MVHASLFSGIGGFDLAAEWAGWSNAFNCEIDPFCRKVLKYHFPNAEQYEDIKSTDFTIWRGKSTFSPEGSHANHSQQQGNVKVQPITVTSGRKCLEQFGKFVPAGSWAKTFSELLVGMEGWFSSRCTLTWKLKGTKSRRLYFQLVESMPHTKDTERGLLLKTPSAMDARSENLSKKEQKFGNSGTLAQEVQTGFIYKRRLLPTVQTQGLKVNQSGKTVFMKISLLPTPTANDGKNATLPESQKNRSSLVSEVMQKKKYGQDSQLNPLFVQEMMGFPYLWTELPFQSGEQNQSKPMVTR